MSPAVWNSCSFESHYAANASFNSSITSSIRSPKSLYICSTPSSFSLHEVSTPVPRYGSVVCGNCNAAASNVYTVSTSWPRVAVFSALCTIRASAKSAPVSRYACKALQTTSSSSKRTLGSCNSLSTTAIRSDLAASYRRPINVHNASANTTSVMRMRSARSKIRRALSACASSSLRR